jgi:hypothetical protein
LSSNSIITAKEATGKLYYGTLLEVNPRKGKKLIPHDTASGQSCILRKASYKSGRDNYLISYEKLNTEA